MHVQNRGHLRGAIVPPPGFAGHTLGATDRAVERVLALVVQRMAVPKAKLFMPSRGKAQVAASRQLAMYLVHVALGRTLTEVGEIFGRDRTTVAHACRLIEDQRDNLEFDEMVSTFEETIETGNEQNQVFLRHHQHNGQKLKQITFAGESVQTLKSTHTMTVPSVRIAVREPGHE